MAEARGSVLHQQALVVMGLFAGFAMTALVVIMQSPASFRLATGPLSGEAYFEGLVTLIALVASAGVFGVLATMEVAGGIAATGSGMDRFAYACFLIALAGLLVILPMLLLPFTPAGGLVLLAAEAILLFAYYMSRPEPPFPRNR